MCWLPAAMERGESMRAGWVNLKELRVLAEGKRSTHAGRRIFGAGKKTPGRNLP